MIELSFSSKTAHFSQEHLLFGKRYVMEFQWLERDTSWVMHIYDHDENPIALGLRLSQNWPIYVDKNLGLLFFLIAKKINTEVSLSSLHEDFTMVVDAII